MPPEFGAALSGRKSFYEIDGGHFGLLWTDGPLFEEAAAAQVDFLRTHLPVTRSA